MNTKLKILLGALCLVPGLLRGEFRIDWWGFGALAGPSTGGGWGLAGRADNSSGTASGGPFALTGGYWSIIATVPTPGSPQLTVERAESGVRLSWPRSAEAFTLEESPTLLGTAATPWTASAHARETNATRISVTVPLPVGSRYFRLKQ
jgi:hypothetical protein